MRSTPSTALHEIRRLSGIMSEVLARGQMDRFNSLAGQRTSLLHAYFDGPENREAKGRVADELATQTRSWLAQAEELRVALREKMAVVARKKKGQALVRNAYGNGAFPPPWVTQSG